MHEIMAMVIVATITYGIYKLFELFARRKERMAMIEKLSSGIDPQLANNPLKRPVIRIENYGSWAIRVGLLLVGVGLGVAIATIVDLVVAPPSQNLHDGRVFYEFRNTISILYPACAAIFGGIGLVVAYFVEKKHDKKD